MAEENEKITLLNQQTKDMAVNLENLTQKRKEAKERLEARFTDVYKNINQTKVLVINEGKRIRNEIFQFKTEFNEKLVEFNEKNKQTLKEIEERTNMKFEEVDKFALKLKEMINKEEEDRKIHIKNLLHTFDGKLNILKEKI